MRRIHVNDGGRVFTLLLREDISVPKVEAPTTPGHVQFIGWWREQAVRRGLPSYHGGFKLARRLLVHHSLEELQELAVHFMLEHGTELKTMDVGQHLVHFQKLIPQMERELKEGQT